MGRREKATPLGEKQTPEVRQQLDSTPTVGVPSGKGSTFTEHVACALTILPRQADNEATQGVLSNKGAHVKGTKEGPSGDARCVRAQHFRWATETWQDALGL